MNKTEKEYAVKRIEGISRIKASDIKMRYPKVGKSLTKKEKVNLIRTGKAKLKKSIDYSSYRLEIDYIFDWPVDKNIEKAENQMNAELKALRDKTTAIKDEIMLGDEERALKLIREFEKS